MAGDLALLLGVLTLGLLSPGPDFILVLRNSVGGSRTRGLGTVLGIVVGLAVQTSAIALGISAMPADVMRGLGALGAMFLAWLGWRALFSRAEDRGDAALLTRAQVARSAFVEGLVCNATNPKAFLFFGSVFTHFIQADTPSAWRIGLPVLVVAHAAVLWSLVVLALQSAPVARQLQRVQQWLPRIFGVSLLVLAALVIVGVASGE